MSSPALSQVGGDAQALALPAERAVPAVARAAAIRRLDLSEFRSYASLRLEVAAAPVVLTGVNGAGKTNLLEALSFLAPGRGLRRAALGEVTRQQVHGASAGWAVAARIDTPRGTVSLGSGLDGPSGARRVVHVDGAPARGQAALAEHVSIVWLTPEMDRLFMEGTSRRRRFVDRMVFGFDPEHATRLAAYEQALRERQRLLRDGAGDRAWLAVLEETMASNGTAVAAARRELVTRLDSALKTGDGAANLPFPRAGIALDGELEGWLAVEPALAVEDRFRAALEAARSSDRMSGRTAHGPHRSDLLVRHWDKDMAAGQCSTGEQKALLIAIILAHVRLLALDRGAAPVLLLDEVAAHLDEGRRTALADRLGALGAQAWLTGTDPHLFDGFRASAQFLHVTDGSIVHNAAP